MRHVIGGTGRRYSVEDTELNSGGQAKLYRCRDDKGLIRVYKQYLRPLHDTGDIAQLVRVQRMGHGIVAHAEGARSLGGTAPSSVNWPIDLIRPGHEVDGVVLPLIPADFMRDGKRPRTLDFLSLARANPPRAAVRVGVLVRVCDIFAYLESERLLHGDVSAKNVVWRPSPPHAYLIDSDGMRSFSPAPTKGVCTPGWEDPRLQAKALAAHDRYSDRYALALALYKCLFLNPGGPCFVNGSWSGVSGIPRALDPRLRRLFARALDEPLATVERPTAVEWRQVLTSVFLDSGNNYRRAPLDVLEAHAKQYRDAHARQGRAAGTATAGRAPALVAAARPAPAPTSAPAPAPRVPARARTTRKPARRLLGVLAFLALAAAALAVQHELDGRSPAQQPSAGTPCPAEIAARIPDGSGAVMLNHYVTDLHDITLCRAADNTVYYHGGLLDRPDAGTITIPATETSTGYRAPTGDYLYEIDGSRVLVTLPSGTTKSYRLTDVTDQG
ncbi:hypothetical protein GCM10011583_55340 [Streptomyces camponoticapitis]|uniref:Protein kinase domain-containing protein n=1 Tax=Streptomyces camponoticapitis TaxID=1616125 RepID=A0ABQ2EM88_9ACTN|nr:hypothetical protein [Streptomyces camponoticapitis]GGK16364.1 hypothetical protein GCM10011583_55340 [Streptomyces camponoticapitis]